MTNGINRSIGLSAVRAASRVMNNSAHQVANVSTAEFKSGSSHLTDMAPGVSASTDPGGQPTGAEQGLSDVNLTRETTTQIGAQSLYRANLASLRTEDEILGTAINIKR